MSHNELKELSISAYGHRHKLLRAAKLQVQGPQSTIIQGKKYPFIVVEISWKLSHWIERKF